MKNILLLFFCFIFYKSSAQKIRFEYDFAGNQILRTLCANCSSRVNENNIKEFDDLEENDFLKFFPEDEISYYPNPVKEDLFLKWNFYDEIFVNEIEIISLNGMSLKKIKNNDEKKSILISFAEFPTGIYFVNLIFKNDDFKSIKIIKN
ncbi:T9SS type A sorting domain-containing protein [Flavobacterium sp.]|uniref:T9SS type A sorting domain-containing protein n=1 Tax=Flavobacterium sp. TaxID=239 RepID=UPI0039E5131E